MNIPYVFRKCSKCGEILLATEEYFNKKKGGKYGLNSKCKKCRKKYYQENKEHIAERKRQYYKDNKETLAERNRQYREANKEAEAERCKQWREANKEAIAEYNRQYYKDNKEARAEQSRRYYQSPQGQVVAFNKSNRRRAKEQAQGRGITKEQWLECMKFFGFRCAYSGEYLGGKDNQSIRSLDHIVPLNKGGANEIWNVIPMIKSLNSSKNDKNMLEWYTEQPYFSQDRLNKIYEWQEYAFNKWGNINTKAQ